MPVTIRANQRSASPPAGRAPYLGSIWDDFATGGDPSSSPVAVGGNLMPGTLMGAYRRGIFPWPPNSPDIVEELERDHAAAVRTGEIPNLDGSAPGSLEIPWWSPDPRGVLRVDDVHIPHMLRRRLRSCGWETTVDAEFAEVMRRCRRGDVERSWISARMIDAYSELSRLGWAHSIEVWDEDELIGGAYGVHIGAVFTGESMFWVRPDASKVSLVDLADRFAAGGGVMIDLQMITDHFRLFGAFELPRDEFCAELERLRDRPAVLLPERLPVDRLASTPDRTRR